MLAVWALAPVLRDRTVVSPKTANPEIELWQTTNPKGNSLKGTSIKPPSLVK